MPKAHGQKPTAKSPRPKAHGHLPTDICPRTFAHGHLPTAICPRLFAHGYLPTAISGLFAVGICLWAIVCGLLVLVGFWLWAYGFGGQMAVGKWSWAFFCGHIFGGQLVLHLFFAMCINLTEVAGEGGPHLAPQKFLLSQQFRYLMRCKKYLKKKFLSCLVSEIQLFVYIFG